MILGPLCGQEFLNRSLIVQESAEIGHYGELRQMQIALDLFTTL